MAATSVTYRLKKAREESFYGPMEEGELKQLAQSAMVAPEDLVDRNDDKWVPAGQIEFLEMDWNIHTADGNGYGPTTIGTIREFFGGGEITVRDEVIHVRTQEKKTVGDLLGLTGKEVGQLDGAASAPVPRIGTDTTRIEMPSSVAPEVVRTMDTAKDLRIRQLELDMQKLQREYETLLQKYRKLSQEFAETVKKS
jgi:hypothetical protein